MDARRERSTRITCHIMAAGPAADALVLARDVLVRAGPCIASRQVGVPATVLLGGARGPHRCYATATGTTAPHMRCAFWGLRTRLICVCLMSARRLRHRRRGPPAATMDVPTRGVATVSAAAAAAAVGAGVDWAALLSSFPPVRFAAAYGSGVFEQGPAAPRGSGPGRIVGGAGACLTWCMRATMQRFAKHTCWASPRFAINQRASTGTFLWADLCACERVLMLARLQLLLSSICCSL